MTTDAYRGALDAVERIINRGGDADDVLRSVAAALLERIPHFTRVAIAFVEDGRLELGPEAGSGDGEEIRSSVTFAGAPVGERLVGQPRLVGARRPIRVLVRMGAAALLPLPLLTL